MSQLINTFSSIQIYLKYPTNIQYTLNSMISNSLQSTLDPIQIIWSPFQYLFFSWNFHHSYFFQVLRFFFPIYFGFFFYPLFLIYYSLYIHPFIRSYVCSFVRSFIHVFFIFLYWLLLRKILFQLFLYPILSIFRCKTFQFK